MTANQTPTHPPHNLPIPDLLIRPLAFSSRDGITRWPALRDTDPLLRRFGLAEVLRISPQGRPSLRCRAAADEVWALLEGAAEFLWHDLRPESPSHGHLHRLLATSPTVVLAPFGVAFGLRAVDGPALLLRLATHSDVDPEASADREYPWPNQD